MLSISFLDASPFLLSCEARLEAHRAAPAGAHQAGPLMLPLGRAHAELLLHLQAATGGQKSLATSSQASAGSAKAFWQSGSPGGGKTGLPAPPECCRSRLAIPSDRCLPSCERFIESGLEMRASRDRIREWLDSSSCGITRQESQHARSVGVQVGQLLTGIEPEHRDACGFRRPSKCHNPDIAC